MNDGTRSNILVVEDDPAVRNLVTTALGLHGYDVEAATNGETAILDAASRNPALIMLDLGLPDIDGVDVISKVRSWSAVPIIVISARTEDSDKIGALDAGADDYLTKPFSVEEMLARVRATCDARPCPRPIPSSRAPSTTGACISTMPRGTPSSTASGSRSRPPSTSSSCFGEKRRQGAHAHVHHARNLGDELG